MTIKIIINGANGRMGKSAVAYLPTQTDLSLVATAGRKDDLAGLIKQHQADVVVDLTTAEVAFDNASTIINAGARAVIGTSGFNDEHIATLQAQCKQKKLGGVIAPNFSISAILMMQLATQAAAHLPSVEIIEYHHDQKKDAPSGTAAKTAHMINAARKAAQLTVPPDPTTIELEQYPGCRGGHCHSVPTHSVRLPGFIATQEVIFGNTGETLSIRHSTINRDAFMPGIALACRRVMTLNELVYGLDNLL